ncbi:DUF2625 family protein [Aquabacter sp. CN5-332]|uniref:DUF2625 family protein n=1 Tax=Aquabacter sp. CN5-332 TaxID=3156608 RepID=UPI0032B56BB4
MRGLEDLIDTDDPGIRLVRDWAGAKGGNASVILPPDAAVRGETLLRLQVTTRSILGAVAYDTGGISVADGRLRLLGSGPARSLRACNDAAGGMRTGALDDFLLIADDMLGGLYALNGGRFGREGLGDVFHLAADQLLWSHLEVDYADFASWCLTGDLGLFYEGLAGLDVFQRPPSFEKTYAFYPFLWTREAEERAPDVRLVDADEGVRLRLEMAGFGLG